MVSFSRKSKVLVGEVSDHPAGFGAGQETLLDQVWFVNFFNRANVFGESARQSFDPDRAAAVMLDNMNQEFAIGGVEAEMINFEDSQGFFDGRLI